MKRELAAQFTCVAKIGDECLTEQYDGIFRFEFDFSDQIVQLDFYFDFENLAENIKECQDEDERDEKEVHEDILQEIGEKVQESLLEFIGDGFSESGQFCLNEKCTKTQDQFREMIF